MRCIRPTIIILLFWPLAIHFAAKPRPRLPAISSAPVGRCNQLPDIGNSPAPGQNGVLPPQTRKWTGPDSRVAHADPHGNRRNNANLHFPGPSCAAPGSYPHGRTIHNSRRNAATRRAILPLAQPVFATRRRRLGHPLMNKTTFAFHINPLAPGEGRVRAGSLPDAANQSPAADHQTVHRRTQFRPVRRNTHQGVSRTSWRP